MILPVQIWKQGKWRLLWLSLETRVYHVTELVYMSVEIINLKMTPMWMYKKIVRLNHSIILQDSESKNFSMWACRHIY